MRWQAIRNAMQNSKIKCEAESKNQQLKQGYTQVGEHLTLALLPKDICENNIK
jgi:hypothetical protein